MNVSAISEDVLSYLVLQKLLGFRPKVISDVMVLAKDNPQVGLDIITSDKNFISEFGISDSLTQITKTDALKKLEKLQDFDCKFLLRNSDFYPSQLRLIRNSPFLLYVRGDASALSRKGVSIVGSRKASPEGQARANRAAKLLGDKGYVVVSGLAAGIDTAAHIGALQNGVHTTAVIGTPILQAYPKENSHLQEIIANRGTLVSQFSPLSNVLQHNFPQRNEVMSGLSWATVIVEAGETSGALIQARFALSQGRALFIMQSQIEKTEISWPKKFLSMGAKSLISIDNLISDLDKLVLEEESIVGKKQLSLL